MMILRIFRLIGNFLLLPFSDSLRRKRFERISSFVRQVGWSLMLIVGAIATGIIGYMLIEKYSFFDAYYMTVITLATVGYGEVHKLSFAGRLFTTLLIFFNLGIFTYAITTISSTLADGSFLKLLKEFTMLNKIDKLQHHVIVCGFGRHAQEVAVELSKQNEPFVIIENQERKIDDLRKIGNYLFIEGDATDDNTLEEAGISRATALIITLPKDADNLFIVLSARQMNPTLRIISRAVDIRDELKLKRAGADHVVTPERIGGFYMATLTKKPDLVEFFNLLSNIGPSNVIFEEVAIKDMKPQFQHQTIRETRIYRNTNSNIVALRYRTGQYILNPVPDTVLSPDMHLVVLGNEEQIKQFKTYCLNEK